jgi:hypothetical protein
MWSGEFVVRDSLGPKETVVVEGVFLVPKENENHVSLGDLATEGSVWLENESRWLRLLKTSERKSPLIRVYAPGGGNAEKATGFAQLEQWTSKQWKIVEKFLESVDNLPLYSSGFIDRVI